MDIKKLFSFNKTVRGYNHISKDIPCEDFSTSFISENENYRIIAVADGHGSSACFRSSYGSKKAVEIVVDCFKNFVEGILDSEEKEKEFYQMFFNNPRYQQSTLERLIGVVSSRWNVAVQQHYQENPVSSDELQDDKDVKVYENNIPHIYGTTLMAGLMLSKCLILIHQGDGRCNVFYKDGHMEQPVPWDSRCEFNTTTSMCDSDVATSFRYKVINLEQEEVIACYMGSDGVEDAYGDTWESLNNSSHKCMGGVYTFYKILSREIVEKGTDEFEQYLEEKLPPFSENGSGDDISVAGIVDVEALSHLIDKFKYDIELYHMEDDLLFQESRLKSKTRKHSILQKRLAEAKQELEVKQSYLLREKQRLENLIKEKAELIRTCDRLKIKIAEDEKVLKDMNDECNPGLDMLNRVTEWWGFTIVKTKERGSTVISDSQISLQKTEEAVERKEAEIHRQSETIKTVNDDIVSAQAKYDEQKTKFDEYDEQYQAIQREIDKINLQISKLR